MCTCIIIHMHLHIHMIHACMHAYIHTKIHTHTYIPRCTLIQMCTSFLKLSYLNRFLTLCLVYNSPFLIMLHPLDSHIRFLINLATSNLMLVVIMNWLSIPCVLIPYKQFWSSKLGSLLVAFIYAHTPISIHIHMHICICIYAYICIPIHTHTYIYIHTHIYTRMNHTWQQTHAHTHTNTQIGVVEAPKLPEVVRIIRQLANQGTVLKPTTRDKYGVVCTPKHVQCVTLDCMQCVQHV